MSALVGFFSCMGFGTSCQGFSEAQGREVSFAEYLPEIDPDSDTNAVDALLRVPVQEKSTPKSESEPHEPGESVFAWIGNEVSRSWNEALASLGDEEKLLERGGELVVRSLRRYDDNYRNRDAFGRPYYNQNGDLAGPLDDWLGDSSRYNSSIYGDPLKERLATSEDIFWGDERINSLPSLKEEGEWGFGFTPRLSGLRRFVTGGDAYVGFRARLQTPDAGSFSLKFRYEEGGEIDLFVDWGFSF